MHLTPPTHFYMYYSFKHIYLFLIVKITKYSQVNIFIIFNFASHTNIENSFDGIVTNLLCYICTCKLF